METIDYTINDQIIALADSIGGTFKKDELYIAKSLITGCKHYPILVDIGAKSPTGNCRCPQCGSRFQGIFANALNFKKAENLVDISELTEVLEKPAFS